MSKRLVLVPVLAAILVFSIVGFAQAQSVVTMSTVEFAFQPSTVRVASGTVTFNVRNDGQFPHNIQFDGQANPVFADNLAGGASATASVNLPPGTYTFYCPVDGHRDRGMVGTLTVAGAQSGRAGDYDPLLLAGGMAVIGALLLGGGYLHRRGVV